MGPDEKSSSILSPFLLSRAVFSTWQTYPNLSHTLWRPAPNAAVPCSLHSTPDDLAHADRLRTETHRGLNENLAGARVTVGPLSKKDLPFSQICDKFHENVTIFDLT